MGFVIEISVYLEFLLGYYCDMVAVVEPVLETVFVDVEVVNYAVVGVVVVIEFVAFVSSVHEVFRDIDCELVVQQVKMLLVLVPVALEHDLQLVYYQNHI